MIYFRPHNTSISCYSLYVTRLANYIFDYIENNN